MPVTPQQVLTDHFGHTDFRPGQASAVQAFLSGRDVAVVLPTGAGKSLCFQVPAVVRAARGEGATLVVSPLIALMQDQVEALQARGIAAVALHSGVDAETHRARLQAARTATLIYVSPERLAKKAARDALTRLGIAAVAIDEAHCISQWGHDFRPDYRKLGELRAALDVPFLAATATATGRVLDDLCASLGLRQPHVVRGDVFRSNLRYAVEHLQGDKARVARAAEWLDQLELGRGGPGRAIFYAATRRHVTSAAKALRARGFAAEHYHAGRTPGARQNAAARFTSGRKSVMVATNAFGMGIDHPDVRLVVHLQAPGSLEAWYQEVGRAGRDGQTSHVTLLYAHADARTQANLRGRSAPPGAEVGFKALQDLVFGDRCRQQDLATWFLDAPGQPCGTCDVCTRGDEVAADVAAARGVATERRVAARKKVARERAVQLETEQVAAIVRFVEGLRKPLGGKLVAGGLRGSAAKPVKRKGLSKNPEFAALKGVPERAILDAIDELLIAGRLARRGRKYPTLWIPDKRVRAPAGAARAPRKPRYSGLEAELARYRSKEARRRRWKPYQVFDNATLKALASARPRTLAELEAVPGMGPTRVQRYGADLLDLLG